MFGIAVMFHVPIQFVVFVAHGVAGTILSKYVLGGCAELLRLEGPETLCATLF